MAKQTKLSQGLSKEQFNELTQVLRDPFFFSTFIYLIHPVRGKVKFDLFPFQRKLLWYFLTERFSIVLKFRQAGVTELISMYCLWLAMYHANKNIVIISLKDRVAKKVLRKIKYMYKNLPEHLKIDIVNGRTNEIGTAQEMEFANGSIISSIPTTEDAGRSEGLSLMVIDEAAIIRYANLIWQSAFPTLSTGGAAIINSTPYGVGNWYHKMWVDACSGGNGFKAIRLHWWMHPERGKDWYNEMAAQLGRRKTAQEIDGDFLTSGNNVFNMADIRAIAEMIKDYTNKFLNPDFSVQMNGQLLTYKNPVRDEQYYIGADVATGRSRDYSAFSIMNRKGEEYASFRGKIGVDKFADLLMKQGKLYNRATIAPESNDIGLATVMKIESSGYPNLYYSTALVKEKGKRKPVENKIPGWLTTKANRPVIIDGLEEDVRNDNIDIKDPHFVAEAGTFIYDEANKPVAMNKSSKSGSSEDDDDVIYTDDTILAKAITNHIRKGKFKSGNHVPPAS